jgi:hypothetical protein
MQIPARRNDGRGDVLGADVAFGEAFFVGHGSGNVPIIYWKWLTLISNPVNAL